MNVLKDHVIINNFVQQPKNIWEIGVGQPELCRTIPYIYAGIPVKMFEPLQSNYIKLVKAFGKFSNANINNFALFDEDSDVVLREQGECSSIVGIKSPVINHYGTDDAIQVPKSKIPALKINHFDYGQIDVALIDTEGCEWKIISSMVSRPRLICFEACMGLAGDKPYFTPNYEKILEWMKFNHYEIAYKDPSGEGDFWFYKTK
jgi:hypothetical protein